MGIFTGLVGQWVFRRFLELGGIFGTLWAFYSTLPPGAQEAIQQVLQGNWQNVTLGAIVPILMALFGYIWSFVSTTRPHVATRDGKQIILPKRGEGSETTRKVETLASAAPKPKTLWESLTGR